MSDGSAARIWQCSTRQSTFVGRLGRNRVTSNKLVKLPSGALVVNTISPRQNASLGASQNAIGAFGVNPAPCTVMDCESARPASGLAETVMATGANVRGAV